MNTNQAVRILFLAGLLSAVSLPSFAANEPSADWKWDGSLYFLGAAMTGDVTVHGVTADLNVGFDQILDNLQFGAMGKLRVSNRRWAVATDVIYMGLGAAKNGVSVDFDQWCVEPTVGYHLGEGFELLAGVRYNSLSGELRLAPNLPNAVRVASGTQDWFDPIVGFNYDAPVVEGWNFHLRADIGGSSGLTWQVYPALNWHFSDTGSLQMGYRWVDNDYSTGSGTSLFRYNVMTEGPQLGVNIRF
jgi:hypothetical protein